MVVGLGVDLVEWSRVTRALERWGDRFVAKLMDPEEARRRQIADMKEKVKLDDQQIASGESSFATPTFQFDEVGFAGVAVGAGDTPYLNVSVDDVQVLGL
jgi:iron only hydrogenase large subunit-like protein